MRPRRDPIVGKKRVIPYLSFLTLLQVLFDPLGLAEQKRNMLVGRFGEPFHHLERLLELLDELVVLAVAPRLTQPGDLAVQLGQLGDHLVVELLEPGGEAA